MIFSPLVLWRYSPGVRCALGCRYLAATPGLRPSASGSTSSAQSLELSPKLPWAIVEGRAGILRHLYVSAPLVSDRLLVVVNGKDTCVMGNPKLMSNLVLCCRFVHEGIKMAGRPHSL